MKKVLFISYWGANEGLSQATVNPHLKILIGLEVDMIYYISAERKPEKSYKVPSLPQVHHIPVRINRLSKLHFLNKFLDLLLIFHQALKVVRREKIIWVICRSAMAGIFGHWLKKWTGVFYTVESFEPHADYMLQAGVWSKGGISYTLETQWENQIKRTADYLMPVTESFKNRLISEGVGSERIKVMPCAVDTDKFKFNPEDKEKMRKELSISHDHMVGIYVGKFGGIYYDDDAFELFGLALQQFEYFHLIVLTQEDYAYVAGKLNQAGFRDFQFTVRSVTHEEVPLYLSAADFAFSLHLPTQANRYVSPIKNGEYWANGLPVLMNEGVGDDCDIIKREENGALFTKEIASKIKAFSIIKDQQGNNQRRNILARKYRNFAILSKSYSEIVDELIETRC